MLGHLGQPEVFASNCVALRNEGAVERRSGMPKMPALRPRRHFNTVEHRFGPVPAGSAIVSARDTILKPVTAWPNLIQVRSQKLPLLKSLSESETIDAGIGSAYFSFGCVCHL